MPRKPKSAGREARRQRELRLVNEKPIDNRDRLCPRCGLSLARWKIPADEGGLVPDPRSLNYYRNYSCLLDGCRIGMR